MDSLLRHEKPSHVRMKGEHQSNIFALAFDASNRHVLSGGNDEQVIVHDVATREALDVLLFSDSIYCIAPHPVQESLFGTACEDGSACLFDRRSNALPMIIVEQSAAMQSLAFNNAEPRLVATANKRSGLCLWDVRMPKRKLLRYGSSGRSRRIDNVHRSYMCVRFSRDGRRLLGLRRRHPIAVFDTASPSVAAELDAPSYLNSCTMKSCCFAGEQDGFVAAGSDDFGVYLWRLPLQSEAASGQTCGVSEPHAVLRGHRSIVNQVRYCAASQLLVTSGVEKLLRAWTPFGAAGAVHSHGLAETDFDAQTRVQALHSIGLQTSEWLRPLCTHEEYIRVMNGKLSCAKVLVESRKSILELLS